MRIGESHGCGPSFRRGYSENREARKSRRMGQEMDLKKMKGESSDGSMYCTSISSKINQMRGPPLPVHQTDRCPFESNLQPRVSVMRPQSPN